MIHQTIDLCLNNLVNQRFFLLSRTSTASSISRNEEINHDFLCANHAYDTQDCQIYARDKWGKWFAFDFRVQLNFNFYMCALTNRQQKG